jgi:hypothetical protein
LTVMLRAPSCRARWRVNWWIAALLTEAMTRIVRVND